MKYASKDSSLEISQSSKLLLPSAFVMPGRVIQKWFRPLPSLFLLGILLGFACLRYFDVSIESAQSIVFPIFALAFWFLPTLRDSRVPKALLSLAFLGWAWAGLHIRGYLPELFSGSTVYLSNLNQDATGESGRDLLRRYNVIASAYHLPPMDIVLRSFVDSTQANLWSARRKNSELVISGSAEWLNLNLPSKLLRESSREEIEAGGAQELRELLHTEAARLSVDLEARVRIIQLPGSRVPLVMSLGPDVIQIPGEPSELSRHYIGWLVRGIHVLRHEFQEFGDRSLPTANFVNFKAEQIREYRYDALSQLTMMLGAWKSPVPISYARFLLGTQELSELIETGGGNQQLFLSCLNYFRTAQKNLRPTFDADLLALAKNNNALLFTFFSNDDEDRARARKEFWNAAQIVHNNQPVLGARIALLNLTLLDAAGELSE